MKRRFSIKVLGILLVAGFAASQVWAETIRLMVFNTNVQVGAGGVSTCLDLSTAAGNQPVANFSTPAGGRVIARFNAECSVAGAATNWLNTDIIIDPNGAAAPGPFVAFPSDSDNALCSGNGTATFNDGYVSALTQVIGSVPAGVHTIRVCVTGVAGAAAAFRIDDLSLTVESEP